MAIEIDFVSYLVLAAVHPCVGNMRHYFASEIIVNVLFERTFSKSRNCPSMEYRTRIAVAVAILSSNQPATGKA